MSWTSPNGVGASRSSSAEELEFTTLLIMSRLLLFLAFVPALVFAQTHSIDSHEVYISGNIDAANVANNTYYQAINQVQVDWSIIEVVGPEDWEHSSCFPNCHDIGVTEVNNAFETYSEQ